MLFSTYVKHTFYWSLLQVSSPPSTPLYGGAVRKGITGWAVTWHSANHLTTHVTPAARTCLCFSHDSSSLYLFCHWPLLLLASFLKPSSSSASSLCPLTLFIHPHNCTLTPSLPVIRNLIQFCCEPGELTTTLRRHMQKCNRIIVWQQAEVVE